MLLMNPGALMFALILSFKQDSPIGWKIGKQCMGTIIDFLR